MDNIIIIVYNQIINLNALIHKVFAFCSGTQSVNLWKKVPSLNLTCRWPLRFETASSIMETLWRGEGVEIPFRNAMIIVNM